MFNRNIMSIDIGSKNIKVAIGKKGRNNNIVVDELYQILTPEDSFEDGKILNLKLIKESLVQLMKNNKMKTKNTIISIESTKIITREIIIPSVKKQEISSTIRFQLEQYLPVVIDDYIVEYILLEEFEEEGIKKMKFSVTVIPKDVVEEYLDLLKDLKLKPLAMDKHSNAISKLFIKDTEINKEEFKSDETVAVIDMGHKHINVNLIKDGKSLFSRLITKGGNNISMDIANSFNISIEEADSIKTNYRINDKIDNLKRQMIEDIIKSTISDWVNEMNRIFQYYLSRDRKNIINKIYIYGGSSNLENVVQQIEDELNIPTMKLENMSNLKLAKNIEQADVINYLNAISAINRR